MSNRIGDRCASGTADQQQTGSLSDTPRSERRTTPRYPVDIGLFASIDGQTVRLHNISEQGVAIQAKGLDAGSVHLLEINLDRQHVSVSIEVLACSNPDLLHARFVELNPETRDLVEHYIRDLLALRR